MAFHRCRAGTAPEDGRPAQARLAAFLVLIVSFFAVASIALPLTALAVSSDAQQLLNLINQDRGAVGLQPLTLRDDLVQVAANHSAWMASTGSFQHRTDLSAGVTGPWSRIGENIAYGWSVSNIHRMFMESEGHCKNNLYAGFNRVGVEFATGGNGAKYVTVVFVQESGGALPATTLCPYDYSATTTTTVPPASTTTTVAPPASTTTTVAPPASTTTTVPPLTSTTAPTTVPTDPPLTTSTNSAAEVSLQLPTTTTAPVPGLKPVESEPEADPVAALGTPDPAGDDDPATLPVVPLAGGALAVTAAGAWWLVAAKRAAAKVAATATWGIPHGGVRPPR